MHVHGMVGRCLKQALEHVPEIHGTGDLVDMLTGACLPCIQKLFVARYRKQSGTV